MLIGIYPVSFSSNGMSKIVLFNVIHFKNESDKFGIAGLILVLSGLIGAVIGGILLDRTKSFK